MIIVGMSFNRTIIELKLPQEHWGIQRFYLLIELFRIVPQKSYNPKILQILTFKRTIIELKPDCLLSFVVPPNSDGSLSIFLCRGSKF